MGNNSTSLDNSMLGLGNDRVGGVSRIADQDGLLDVDSDDAREKGQGGDKECEDSHFCDLIGEICNIWECRIWAADYEGESEQE